MSKIIYLAEGMNGKKLNDIRKGVKKAIKDEKTSISSVLGYLSIFGQPWYEAMSTKVDEKLLKNPKLLCEHLTEKEQVRVKKSGFNEHLVTELQKRLAKAICEAKPKTAVIIKKDVVAEDVACEIVA